MTNNQNISLFLLILLSACSTPTFQFGQAKLLDFNQQKLEQQFPIGAARFDDVKQILGKCMQQRFIGDITQEERDQAFADLKAGRNMSCTYRYITGVIPNCVNDSRCSALEVGLDKHEERTAIFEFDSNGWVKNIKYTQSKHKREDSDDPDVTQKASASDIANEIAN